MIFVNPTAQENWERMEQGSPAPGSPGAGLPLIKKINYGKYYAASLFVP